MNKRLRAFFLSVSLLSVAAVSGQEHDAGLWLSLGAQKKLTPLDQVIFAQEVRWMENISEVSTLYTEAGLEHKFAKWLKFSANYRLQWDRQLNDMYTYQHKVYFDIAVRKKQGIASLTLRERAQFAIAGRGYVNEGYPEILLRSKVAAKFDIHRKYSPFLNLECFNPLNGSNPYALAKCRYAVGMEYQPVQRHAFDLYYLIQQQFGDNTDMDFVVGISYFLSL